jgi:hypothetical protein
MDLIALKTELTTDPIGRGYASKNDEQAAATFSIMDRQPNRETLESGLLVAAIVRSEFAALVAGDKQYVQMVATAPTMPLTATLKTELGAIFPAGSATRANLVALMKRPGNRAEELNLGGIPTTSEVANARRLP